MTTHAADQWLDEQHERQLAEGYDEWADHYYPWPPEQDEQPAE